MMWRSASFIIGSIRFPTRRSMKTITATKLTRNGKIRLHDECGKTSFSPPETSEATKAASTMVNMRAFLYHKPRRLLTDRRRTARRHQLPLEVVDEDGGIEE